MKKLIIGSSANLKRINISNKTQLLETFVTFSTKKYAVVLFPPPLDEQIILLVTCVEFMITFWNLQSD